MINRKKSDLSRARPLVRTRSRVNGTTSCCSAKPCALLHISLSSRISSSESSPFNTRRRSASRCQAGRLSDHSSISSRTDTAPPPSLLHHFSMYAHTLTCIRNLRMEFNYFLRRSSSFQRRSASRRSINRKTCKQDSIRIVAFGNVFCFTSSTYLTACTRR